MCLTCQLSRLWCQILFHHGCRAEHLQSQQVKLKLNLCVIKARVCDTCFYPSVSLILKRSGCEKTHQLHNFIRGEYLGKTALHLGECMKMKVAGCGTQGNKHNRDFRRNLSLQSEWSHGSERICITLFQKSSNEENTHKRITLSIDTT